MTQPGQAGADHGQTGMGVENRAGQSEQAGDPGQGVFGTGIAPPGGPVGGSPEPGEKGGNTGRDVEEPATGALEIVEQAVRFAQIDGSVGSGAEAPGRRQGIGQRDTGRQAQVGAGGSNAVDDPEHDTGPVGQIGAAETAAAAGTGGEQIVQDVAVAGLDVDGIEAGPGSQTGGGDKALDQGLEIVIGEHLCRLRPGIEMGIDRRHQGLRFAGRSAETARMGELEDEQRAVVGAESRPGAVADGLDQLGESPDGGRIEQELTGIRAPLGNHRRGLEPDQTAAPLGVAEIAPPGRFCGRTVGCGIEAFHRVHPQPVGQPHPAGTGQGQLDRFEKRLQLLAPGKVEPQFAGQVQEVVGVAQGERTHTRFTPRRRARPRWHSGHRGPAGGGARRGRARPRVR